MPTDTKIAPRIDENGDPWCVTSCPYFAASPWPMGCESQAAGEACVPALRRQRDKAREDLPRLRTALHAILRQSDVNPGERIPVGTIWRLAHNALEEVPDAD